MTSFVRPSVALTALALALSLGGCGSREEAEDTGPKTMAQAQEEAKKLERPEPGQYKQTVEITKMEVPGMDAKQAEQMKGMMQAGQEHTFCLTSEEADKGFKDMFDEVGKGGECSYSRFDVSGGTLDAVMNCKSQAEGQAKITLHGKVEGQGSDVTVGIEQSGSAMPMGNMKLAMHMTTQRIGDCKP